MNRTNNLLWYAGFLITYVFMLILANQIHWIAPLDVNGFAVSDSSEGKHLSIMSRLAGSAQRWKFYVYDQDLRLQWTRSFYQPYLFYNHTLSNDGNGILTATYLDGHLRFKSLTRNGFIFDNTILIRKEAIAAASNQDREYASVRKTHLLDTPADHILFQTPNEVFLIQPSGKIVDYLGQYASLPSQHTPTVVASIAAEGEFPDPDERFCLNYYSYSSEGLKLIHKEPQDRNSVLRKSKSANSSADMTSQENDHLRILKLNKSEVTLNETRLPWDIGEGQVVQIGDSGNEILIRPAKDEIIVVSSSNGQTIARANASGIVPNTSRFINDSNISFLSQHDAQIKLNVWNWRDGKSKAVAIPFTSVSTQRAANLFFIIMFGLWASAWLWLALRSRNTLHSRLVVTAIFTVALLWLQCHPRTELLTPASSMRYWLALLVCWQIFLSILSIWLFESQTYFRALAFVILLSSYTCYRFLNPIDDYAAMPRSDVLYASMFLYFGFGIAAASLFRDIIRKNYPSCSLADAMLLILAIAVSTKLLITEANFVRMKGYLGTGLLLGCFYVLFTILAYQLSTIRRFWIRCSSVTLLIGVLTISTIYSRDIFQPTWEKSFWIGLTCMTALSGLSSWLILTIIDRCTTNQAAVVDASFPQHVEPYDLESLNWI